MKNTLKLHIIILLSFFFHALNAQNITSRKGKLYMYWGWNQARYTASDIRFQGNDYDFTLENVIAKDRQTPFDVGVYFSPTTITIPQVNYKMGYFWHDKYDISLGVDHMKYVMTQDQTVKINGFINKSDTPFDGVYANKDIILTEDFLTFEHTDGLNYLNVEVNRYDKLTDLSKIKLKGIEINLTEGVSVGALLPRTNTQLLKNKRHDAYHLAGYGAGLKVGLNITFGKFLFFQTDLKGGYINMPNIRTTAFESDGAAQHFFYWQANILFGFQFKI